ncbi:MAG: aromatic ring-hydroxylating oxygenase subunit alpha [Candidatus Rokuibacteriota bacterium]
MSEVRGDSPRLAAAQRLLDRLLVEHKPGHALAREFQTDSDLYQLDVERVWRRGWLFVAHTCEIRRPGDYRVVDFDTDSLIVIRDDGGRLHALHNTCRHRGMKICQTEGGQAGRLVCPYHQWVYGRDGALLSCGGMDSEGDLDRRAFALHGAHVREVGGLIFVSLAAEPPPFEEAAHALGPMLAPQDLDRAKVAAVRRYTVRANWKLVWENNRECWHCQANHPQYVKANYDNAPIDDARLRAQITARAEATSARLRAHGLTIDYQEAGMAPFPTPGRWWSINRTPLVPGWVTESMDGQPVAPLMGRYPTRDVGTLRIRTMPNFWSHASGDHMVSTRLTPAGPETTRIQVQWLVSEDAVEGKDYRLETLLPFWELTSEQDWHLCEQNQAGVSSRAFTPGPYSTKRESNVIRWTEWYLSEVARPAGGVSDVSDGRP